MSADSARRQGDPVYGWHRGRAWIANIEVLTLADRHRKIVARGGSSARYLATSNGAGHLVYINKATLFAIPFDLDKLETRGTAVPVLDDVALPNASAETGRTWLLPHGHVGLPQGQRRRVRNDDAAMGRSDRQEGTAAGQTRRLSEYSKPFPGRQAGRADGHRGRRVRTCGSTTRSGTP